MPTLLLSCALALSLRVVAHADAASIASRTLAIPSSPSDVVSSPSPGSGSTGPSSPAPPPPQSPPLGRRRPSRSRDPRDAPWFAPRRPRRSSRRTRSGTPRACACTRAAAGSRRPRAPRCSSARARHPPRERAGASADPSPPVPPPPPPPPPASSSSRRRPSRAALAASIAAWLRSRLASASLGMFRAGASPAHVGRGAKRPDEAKRSEASSEDAASFSSPRAGSSFSFPPPRLMNGFLLAALRSARSSGTTSRTSRTYSRFAAASLAARACGVSVALRPAPPPPSPPNAALSSPAPRARRSRVRVRVHPPAAPLRARLPPPLVPPRAAADVAPRPHVPRRVPVRVLCHSAQLPRRPRASSTRSGGRSGPGPWVRDPDHRGGAWAPTRRPGATPRGAPTDRGPTPRPSPRPRARRGGA